MNRLGLEYCEETVIGCDREVIYLLYKVLINIYVLVKFPKKGKLEDLKVCREIGINKFFLEMKCLRSLRYLVLDQLDNSI